MIVTFYSSSYPLLVLFFFEKLLHRVTALGWETGCRKLWPYEQHTHYENTFHSGLSGDSIPKWHPKKTPFNGNSKKLIILMKFVFAI